MKHTARFILFVLVITAWAAAAETVDSGYNDCLVCHDAMGARLVKTPHNLGNKVLCADCHGVHKGDDPSAENINTLKSPKPEDVFKLCAKCHTDFRPTNTSHSENGKGCLSCHDMWHTEKVAQARPTPAAHLLPVKTTDACTPCHTAQQAEIMKPYHHQASRIDNLCVQCHDPHRSRFEIRAEKIDRKCASCHPDAAGPFLYKHLGTESDGCRECHMPHGSTNPNLLTRSTTRFLCLSCHTDVPTFHDMSNPRFNQCTSCHSAIHGSNVSSKFYE
jgi:DmsE family decaheme c-type cytochrome